MRAEKKEIDDLICKEPTNKLFVFHFGNGDEEDQRVLMEYAKKFGPIDAIPLFPGLNYGFIEYPEVQQAIDLVDSLEDKKFIDLEFYEKKRTCCFQYSKVEYDQLDKFKTMEFPDSSYDVDIPGLYVVEDFLSDKESVDAKTWLDSQEWTKLMNRRVQHFGYEFVYGANNVNKTDKIREMPDQENDIFRDINDRIRDTLKGFFINSEGEAVRVYDHQQQLINEEVKDPEGMKNYFDEIGDFDQLTVNDYIPGQGIPPHIDTHSPFEEVFMAISLNSEATMTFKSPEGEFRHISLKPNSLMIFSGEGRYNWLHSIPTRKFDKVNGLIKSRRRRISLTYRKLRANPVCACKWPRMCDTQNKEVAVDENKLVGEGEEAKFDADGSSNMK